MKSPLSYPPLSIISLRSSFHPLDKAELSGRAIFIPDQPASGEGDSSLFSESNGCRPRPVGPIEEEDEADGADAKIVGKYQSRYGAGCINSITISWKF